MAEDTGLRVTKLRVQGSLLDISTMWTEERLASVFSEGKVGHREGVSDVVIQSHHLHLGCPSLFLPSDVRLSE